jgi:hypothetical protein
MAGGEAANAQMTAGRVLPWLQDTAAADVWGSWKVTFRDVVVLDASGKVRFVYNLTDHDLHLAANYQSLKAQLLNAR